MKTVSKEYDPIIMGPVRAKPEGFSTWNKVTIDIGDAKLGEFVEHLAREPGVEVMIISIGNACLYNAYLPKHKTRRSQKVTELYEQITGTDRKSTR